MILRYLFCVSVFLTGCASVIGDSTQPITVIAVCAGSAAPVAADCVLQNSSDYKKITSPGTVSITRSHSDLSVTCTRAGDVKSTVILESKSDEKVLGNLVAGGIIGIIVDAGTGAAFNYPSRTTVLLNCHAE